MTQLLLSIAKLQCLQPHQIANTTLVGAGLLLNYWRDWRELPTADLAEYRVTSAIENKSRVYTHTITARLTEDFDIANKHWAFLCTAVNGEKYVVGSAEHPYCVITTEHVMPSRVTEQAGCTLTVTYKSTRGPLCVLD